MKFIISIFTVLMISMSFTVSAQKTVTTKFHVDGVCEMCKERIEKAVDVSGVRYASYDVDKQELEVVHKTKKISEEELHELVAAVGHDTEKVKASAEAYDSLHHCCKYRDGAECDDSAK